MLLRRNQFFHPFVRLFISEPLWNQPNSFCYSQNMYVHRKYFFLHANNKTQAAVLGPTPASDVRNSLASSTGDVCKKDRSSSPLLFLISLSAFLMVTDLALANPPDLIAAAIDDARARRADSQSGKRRLRLSKALRL